MREQRKAIRNLWMNSFKNNRRRNIFVVIALALTTLLISSVIGLGMSFIEANNKQTIQRVGTIADANLNDLTNKQVNILKKDSSIEVVGEQQTIGAVDSQRLKNKKVQMALHWYSKDEWTGLRKEAINDFTGNFPVKENELMAPIAALKELGISQPKVGQKISLPCFIDGESYQKEFILSGYYKEFVIARVVDFSYVLVSDQFAKEYSSLENNKIYSIKYKDNKNLSQKNKTLAKKLKLTETQEIKPTLRESSESPMSTIIGVGMFLAIILISGGLLIYNVLYISIANDIRFYGLLKALGTTKRQLKKIIFNQSLLLSAIGIPLGLVVGFSISQVFIPFVMKATNFSEAVVVSTKPLIYVGACLFSLLVMLLSSIKPANYAAKVSPVLAINFTESKVKKHNVRSRNGGKLYLMAWRNIFRDKKRALIVIVSMTLGITSFVAVNSIVKSMDFEKFVLSEMDYDIMISPSYSSSDNTLSATKRLEKQQVSQQLNQLAANDAISDTRIYYSEPIQVAYDKQKFSDYIRSYNQYFKYGKIDQNKIQPDDFRGEVISIDSAELEKLLTADKKNSFDKKAFEAGETAYIQSDHPEDFRDMSAIQFSTSDKQAHQVEIDGFIPNNYLEFQTGGAPPIFVSKNYLDEIAPNAGIWNAYFNLEKDKVETVSAQFQSFIDEQSVYKIVTKTEMKNRAINEISTMRMMGNTLALILALIGLLNFVNIITTSILARKKELATLESIGMTRKQTNTVLMIEGGYYALIVIGLVLTFGLGITYVLFSIVQKSATYASFSLPMTEIGISLLLMVGICLLTPYLVMKSSGKEALAERIKG
ncbi:ABC transporter permease [Enterococcus hulanensis]|uniref:ABC transporter permease n=1 Tax=Enterococcus hulanensis TaxID=2559929 RepID=UPI002890B1A5|nr:ABC transporter permease [Enterococcus hulanensis]MDT2658838.1 ABC transporter permease [Enterococcus hulanensis]